VVRPSFGSYIRAVRRARARPAASAPERAVFSTAQGVITSDDIFDAALAPEWTSATWPVVIAVGRHRVLLHWNEEAPGTRPAYIGRPSSIELSDITFLGIEDRFIGLITRDGSRHRFLFDDADAARRAEASISRALEAAGASFTVR
jgi:hypothetical protein